MEHYVSGNQRNKGFAVWLCMRVAVRDHKGEKDNVQSGEQLSVNQQRHIESRCCLLCQACSQWAWFISTFVAATVCLLSTHQVSCVNLTLFWSYETEDNVIYKGSHIPSTLSFTRARNITESHPSILQQNTRAVLGHMCPAHKRSLVCTWMWIGTKF